MRFQVGDIVKISKSMKDKIWYGSYGNPENTEGEITEIEIGHGIIQVKWKNEIHFIYKEDMLGLVKRG